MEWLYRGQLTEVFSVASCPGSNDLFGHDCVLRLAFGRLLRVSVRVVFGNLLARRLAAGIFTSFLSFIERVTVIVVLFGLGESDARNRVFLG